MKNKTERTNLKDNFGLVHFVLLKAQRLKFSFVFPSFLSKQTEREKKKEKKERDRSRLLHALDQLASKSKKESEKCQII